MANALKSYVEKFLLNPAASFNVDDEGNEETNAQVVENLADDERVTEQQSRSKLRTRSEALLSETDPRYRGKKVSRQDLNKDVEVDPELTKYFAIENDDADEDEDSEEEVEDSEDEIEDSEDEKEDIEDAIEDDKRVPGRKDKSKLLKSKVESSDDDEEEEEEEDDDDIEGNNENLMTKKQKQHLRKDGEGFSFDDDGDFNKYADDDSEGDSEDESGAEEGEEEEEEDDDDEEEEMEEEVSEKKPVKQLGESIKKFSSEDHLEEIQKSQSVKNQLALYDSLFEIRIGMQKGVAAANQLPQFDTYRDFVRERDPNYIKNLSSAKSTAKKLLGTLLEVQEILLNQNPETRHIISGKKNHAGTESNEEITSSEDEVQKEDDEEGVVSQNRGTKRKLKLEEYEKLLSKRYKSLIPYRDETISRWYEKTKLLSSSRGRDKFSGFEVSALEQLKNILNNKTPLIRRTQLTGVTRGTAYHVLGRDNDSTAQVDKEEYDAEIFDDGDFYSRALEEMLKSKISLSDDMSDVSRKWIEIQKLRKKAKRKVDTKASKGRKLRYEVISKLQQYLAPCCPPQMDDAATNTLFASLFGKGINPVKNGNV